MAVRRRGQNLTPPDRSALLRERAALLARLAQIDAQIGSQPREQAVTRPPETRGR